ncbi:phage major capsid protein [Aquibium sp. LZ166]|uniref:Phage major capsid protein n=1 Tax=Aquibium pacificus TaxID=3153579 RepID=A0ABV3SP36_9HYPH
MDKLEFKAKFTVDEVGSITGIAWPFGSPDRVGDVIHKGAFSVSAAMPILFEHDPDRIVGTWEHVAESDAGLEAKGKLFLDAVPRARDVHNRLRAGRINGLSIGFRAGETKARPGGGRDIYSLHVSEISITANPCHPAARILTVKSAGDAAVQAQKEPAMENEDVNQPEAKADPVIDKRDFDALKARLDRIEAKSNRPTAANNNHPAPANDNAETKAFGLYARRGLEQMSADERKSLTVGTSASAGYLAPETFAAELIKLLKEFSPIRQYARVVTIGAPETKYPRRVGSPTAYWVGETANRTASQGSYEQLSIKPHELATYTDVSAQLLEDNAYDLDGELQQEFAEAFALAEGKAFIVGTGDNDNQPTGLLTNADVAQMVTGATASFPASNPADVLITLYHKLPTTHAQRGVWMMNRNTLATIRKWKDSDGRYLVIDPITAGMPLTMLGRPIVECLDMPDIAAGAFPIVFGDLQGYRIIDRIQLQVLRDPFARATNGEVRFHARRRTGGDVTHPDRFIKLKVAAA